MPPVPHKRRACHDRKPPLALDVDRGYVVCRRRRQCVPASSQGTIAGFTHRRATFVTRSAAACRRFATGCSSLGRSDQSAGPGGLPTVFVVTLWTKQAASGPEEHEVINYVQYANGGWARARPPDDGTLLHHDGRRPPISLNLTNLTAAASGRADASQYTVDYSASWELRGCPRQLAVEEVYNSDLSLRSSVVLSDTSTPGTSAPSSTGARCFPARSDNHSHSQRN